MIQNQVILLVGAMKCGTSSFYSDLALHPSVSRGLVKEPALLVARKKDSAAITRAYQDCFASARQDQVLLDGSTHYTMLPENQGVPELASLVFRHKPRIIYLIREPFGRIRSHFQYVNRGKSSKSCSFKKALSSSRRLINYSSYFTQIKPWIDQFGLDHVRILTIDYWAANRSAVAKSVWGELKLEKYDVPADAFSDVKNQLAERRLSLRLIKFAKLLSGNRLWVFKKYLPRPAVQAAVSLLGSSPQSPVEASFDKEDFEMVWDALVEDFQHLAPLIRHPLEDPCTIWSKKRLEAKYLGGLHVS